MKPPAWFDQLAERERKLLLVFVGILGALVFLLVPLWLRVGVSGKAEENQAYKDAIQAILDQRVALSKRKQDDARVQSRYSPPAPALAGYLAQAADKSGLEIPESQDRPAVPHGKTIKERQTRIRLSKVGLLALTNFLEKVTQGGYPVQISHLLIQKRGAKDDEYDVEMDVSAYDREEPKKPAKPAAAEAGEDEP